MWLSWVERFDRHRLQSSTPLRLPRELQKTTSANLELASKCYRGFPGIHADPIARKKLSTRQLRVRTSRGRSRVSRNRVSPIAREIREHRLERFFLPRIADKLSTASLCFPRSLRTFISVDLTSRCEVGRSGEICRRSKHPKACLSLRVESMHCPVASPGSNNRSPRHRSCVPIVIAVTPIYLEPGPITHWPTWNSGL